jgi:tight adherence protein C
MSAAGGLDRTAPFLLVGLTVSGGLLGLGAALDLPPGVVLPAIGLVLALCTVIGIAVAVRERRARLKRVLFAVNRRSTRAGGAAKTWRLGLLALMRAATRRVSIVKDRQIEEMRRLLVSAGYRSRDAVVVFTFFKLVGPLVFLAGSLLVVLGLGSLGYGLAGDIAVVIAAALLGSKLPDIVVRRKARARLEAIRKGLPDTLDMLVICTEAGLAADAALKRVVAESGRRASALSDELNQLVLELTFLPNRRQALENLARRAPIPSIQGLCNTLIQAEKYGTPLARAFKVLSQEQRNERMMRAEEKAGRLPAIMTVPMMVFILPALFVVLVGPAVLDIMDNFVSRPD